MYKGYNIGTISFKTEVNNIIKITRYISSCIISPSIVVSELLKFRKY